MAASDYGLRLTRNWPSAPPTVTETPCDPSTTGSSRASTTSPCLASGTPTPPGVAGNTFSEANRALSQRQVLTFRPWLYGLARGYVVAASRQPPSPTPGPFRHSRRSTQHAPPHRSLQTRDPRTGVGGGSRPRASRVRPARRVHSAPPPPDEIAAGFGISPGSLDSG
jgi:hypothetical protein